MKRKYTVINPCWGIDIIQSPTFSTLAEARKAYRAAIRESKTACKKRFGSCGVIHVSHDFCRIMIGSKQGYHLWEQWLIQEVSG